MRILLTALALAFSTLTFAIDLAKATIVYNRHDCALAGKMAGVLADDIERVTGRRPAVATKRAKGDNIILSTLKYSVIQHRELKGEWERYAIDTDAHTVYVTGSDARGLAYGVLHISGQIGVSPWYWWADVPVQHRDVIDYHENVVSKSPSVKYRGIFINDEDWGMKTWSALNFEKELGDIGPKTYDKVCELILRLKGNMLAPAMHSCTGAFYSHPESQKAADSWGIMITTSHCEPLLFNNAAESEWNKATDGEWNYVTNGRHIMAKLDSRIKATAKYDNIYTMGMRGLHDEAMKGSSAPKARARILEQVFRDQREILHKRKGRKAEDIPQIFVPYKETLDIYDAGLDVPEDITIVWPDDNYGYMKRVSNEKERRRKGGSGVYYHHSYLGTPHDYLWLNTTPPVLMYEELKKAYEAGADRYWLLNVGDIKPMELGVQTFMDMAWDFNSFNYSKANEYQPSLLASVFGEDKKEMFAEMLRLYYRPAWDRKPEYMGYEIQWDSKDNERLHDAVFDLGNMDGDHYSSRTREYRRLKDMVTGYMQTLPSSLYVPFFEMFGYSALSSYHNNAKFMYAQANHETGSTTARDSAIISQKEIERLRQEYNSLLGGKWNQMISEIPPGFVSQYQNMPVLTDSATSAYRLPEDQIYISYDSVIHISSIKASAPFRVIEGIGTEWSVLQLGEPHGKREDPASLSSSRIDIPFTAKEGADSVLIQISTLPVWPVDKAHSNTFGVSVDGCKPQVCENRIVEWSHKWKLQVMENRTDYLMTFPLSRTQPTHTISLIIGDPGQLVQRITYQTR